MKNWRALQTGQMLLALVLTVVLGISGHSAYAQGRSAIKLDTSICKPASSEQVNWLSQAYRKYAKFLRACRIPKTNELFLLSVWVDDYYTSLPGMPSSENIPLPVLVTNSGEIVGSLPTHFPGESPLSTSLTFSSWRGSWPARVNIEVRTFAEGNAPRFDPLIWDAQSHRYLTNRRSNHAREK